MKLNIKKLEFLGGRHEEENHVILYEHLSPPVPKSWAEHIKNKTIKNKNNTKWKPVSLQLAVVVFTVMPHACIGVTSYGAGALRHVPPPPGTCAWHGISVYIQLQWAMLDC